MRVKIGNCQPFPFFPDIIINYMNYINYYFYIINPIRSAGTQEVGRAPEGESGYQRRQDRDRSADDRLLEAGKRVPRLVLD